MWKGAKDDKCIVLLINFHFAANNQQGHCRVSCGATMALLLPKLVYFILYVPILSILVFSVGEDDFHNKLIKIRNINYIQNKEVTIN